MTNWKENEINLIRVRASLLCGMKWKCCKKRPNKIYTATYRLTKSYQCSFEGLDPSWQGWTCVRKCKMNWVCCCSAGCCCWSKSFWFKVRWSLKSTQHITQCTANMCPLERGWKFPTTEKTCASPLALAHSLRLGWQPKTWGIIDDISTLSTTAVCVRRVKP